MLNINKFQPGSTFEVWFDTFASTGGSVTMTGFALGDIKVYKNGSTTPRSSTNGFTLLDTDGTDFASVTGIHGFSIDLSDNSDAGFWVSGGRYAVVLSTVTVDGQTISKLVAQFTIGEAGSILDTTLATVTSQTSFTLTNGPVDNDALNGCVAIIHDVASAVQQCVGVVWDYVGSSKTVTLLTDPKVFAYFAGDNISFLPDRSLKPSVDNRIADVGSSGEVISAVYDDGAIWLDTVNGVPGAVPYVNGMADYPTSSWANALTLAAALRINRIRVAAGSTVTLTATLTNMQLIGRTWTLAFNGQTIDGIYVEGATLSGTGVAGTNLPVFRECNFGTQTVPPLVALACTLGTTLTLGSAGSYRLVDCTGNTAANAFTTISFNGTASNVRLANWSGASLRISNMSDGSSQLDVSGCGKLTLLGTCTNGAANIAGPIDLTNSSTIPVVVDYARVSEDQDTAYVAGKVIGGDLDSRVITAEGAWVSGHDGYPLQRGVGVLATSQADSGTTTTLVDAARTEAATDHWKGSVLVITSGTMIGLARYITGFTPASDRITFYPALPSAVSTETYEIWPMAAFVDLAGKVLGNADGGGTIADAGVWARNYEGDPILSTAATLAALRALGQSSGWGLNVDAATSNEGGGISGVTSGTTLVGTPTNTYTATSIQDGTNHTITGTATDLDIVYQFLLGSSGEPVGVTWAGAVTGADDTVTVQAWKHTTNAWETIASITGQAVTDMVVRNIPLYARHVGTSAGELGKVYIRFYTASAMTNPVLRTDQLYVTYSSSTFDSSAIADAVWDDPTANHQTAGTTGKALTSAASAGDPWGTALPGAYGAGTAGKLVSDMHNRVGLFTGTGDNTILGFLKAIMRFDVSAPSDVGGTFAPVNDSLETNAAAHITMFSNIASIQSDTDNIQTRLPAALVGGRMDVSVGAMAANVMTSSATDSTYVTELQNGLATSVQAVAIAAAVADVQGRIPAALVSGRMDASVGAMAANVITAAAMDSTAGAEIADAVWDELLAGHLTAGTAGLALSTSSSGGVDPSILADAVWDEVLADHMTAGSTGEQLSEAGGITPSTATMIADYVLRRHWQDAYDSSNGGDPTSGRTLLALMSRFVNRWEVVGTNLVLYLGDDTTIFLTVPLSTAADADQIIGMDPPA